MIRLGNFLFIYKERQINSVFIPAIARVADAVLAEQPVERSYTNNKKYKGHLDYWVLYGSTVFLIELKHTWLATRKICLTNKAISEWKTAMEQLKSINAEEAMSLAYEKLNPLKVAIMVLPFYETLSHKDNGDNYEEIDGEEIRTLLKKLDPEPNFISIWNLHDRLKGPFEYEDKKQVHPYLALAAYVDSFDH